MLATIAAEVTEDHTVQGHKEDVIKPVPLMRLRATASIMPMG